jgi:hypothetical protein
MFFAKQRPPPRPDFVENPSFFLFIHHRSHQFGSLQSRTRISSRNWSGSAGVHTWTREKKELLLVSFRPLSTQIHRGVPWFNITGWTPLKWTEQKKIEIKSIWQLATNGKEHGWNGQHESLSQVPSLRPNSSMRRGPLARSVASLVAHWTRPPSPPLDLLPPHVWVLVKEPSATADPIQSSQDLFLFSQNEWDIWGTLCKKRKIFEGLCDKTLALSGRFFVKCTEWVDK